MLEVVIKYQVYIVTPYDLMIHPQQHNSHVPLFLAFLSPFVLKIAYYLQLTSVTGSLSSTREGGPSLIAIVRLPSRHYTV